MRYYNPHYGHECADYTDTNHNRTNGRNHSHSGHSNHRNYTYQHHHKEHYCGPFHASLSRNENRDRYDG